MPGEMIDYRGHVLRAWAMALVALGLVSSATGQTITEYPALAVQTCEPDATAMCLNEGRFRVTADWRKPDGTTGQGQAVPLTPDSGYFWFFNPANIEMVTKVLNACAVNEHHWVFAAGLTNVEVTLRVVDTHTGSLKTYSNPLSTPYQPVQDTSAFAACQDPTNSVSVDLGLAPSAPPCSGLTEVTGIYQDGNGTYLAGDSFWADTPDGVDLRIRPRCSVNRRLNALLPSAAIALLTGPMSPCQEPGDSDSLVSIQLKIPDLRGAPTGVVGKPSLPPNYPKAESVYFYFVVDSDHDGKFEFGDDWYNFVWQSGIYLTRTEFSDRTVYELTTDLTSPDAELIHGLDVSKGIFCVPLRLMATGWK